MRGILIHLSLVNILKMGSQSCLFLLSVLGVMSEAVIVGNGSGSKVMVSVGMILDMNSTVGEAAESCIKMAMDDFYAVNGDYYRTRLSLYTRNSRNDVVAAASAALDLINNEEVEAIVGPQKSSQAKFVIELGGKAQVPIVSFSATSPSLSPTQNPYFIRTTQDDHSQVKAISDIIQAYGWQEVVLIYEDTEYGNGLIPYLTDAFQQINTRVPYRSVISPSSDDFQITQKLDQLREMQTRVFLVHMIASLASKLFIRAKHAGMMSEGYAWIITAGLASLLDQMGAQAIDSMQGVLGVRPYVARSQKLEDFEVRWRRNFLVNKPNSKSSELNLYGLWAYDTIWALAMAIEKIGFENYDFSKQNSSKYDSSDLRNLRVSPIGPVLLDTILNTTFDGLSGEFHLVQGQLQPSAFEVINVVGKGERIIGYWIPNKGLSRELVEGNSSKEANDTSMYALKAPIWPGDTHLQPKGWVIPITGKKLRVGVPLVRRGFVDPFIKPEHDPYTSETTLTGFSYDVFVEALSKLPFAVPCEYLLFVNSNGEPAGTYDDLVNQIYLQRYDAVVGDVTIVSHRTTFVDFTLPYLESNVAMVVPIKGNERKNIWTFLKPFSWDLWLTTGLAFTFTGLVVWVLEHRINTDFRGPPEQQLGLIFWFSFSTLVFAHREKVVNNWSRFVLIIWVFVVLIITQSYTANLTSMLTIQRLQPAFDDVREIQRKGYFVGYHNGSFVRGLLIEQLKFNESKLRAYKSPEECHEALSKGSDNGGVAVVFDETPYLKIFLAKYCNRYKMVGPVYRTDGFGFAFPLGSPLVAYMSRKILNITQDTDKMEGFERKYFSPQGSDCKDQSILISSDSFSVYSFLGLFIITGIVSMSALLIYIVKFFYFHWHLAGTTDNAESSIWSKVTNMAKHFDQPSSNLFKRNESRVHPVISDEDNGDSTEINEGRDGNVSFHEAEAEVEAEEEEESSEREHGFAYMSGCA